MDFVEVSEKKYIMYLSGLPGIGEKERKTEHRGQVVRIPAS